MAAPFAAQPKDSEKQFNHGFHLKDTDKKYD